MKLSRTKVILALTGVVLLLDASPGRADKQPPPARHLPAPEHVSAQTRHEIKARMGQHGVTMQNLVRAVVLLDRPTIQVLANRIADEEVLARASGIRDKDPPVLPPAFFATQDELAAAARQLAGAAVEGGDDKLLADRFGAVTRTCVSCHGTYLHDRPERLPLHPKAKPEPSLKPPPQGAR